MDRRDFVRGLGALGLAPGAVSLAQAAEPAAGQDESSAMLALLDTLRELRETYLTPRYGISRPEDVAEGERMLAHLLHTGMRLWLEADPERPVFAPYVTPQRKLLGDNPDALYYFAPIRGDRAYRIRGQLGGATFTSFTVEAGGSGGGVASQSVAELSDADLEVDADGRFEILLSASRGDARNWLPLTPEASQVTTRHYYETPACIAAQPQVAQELSIEALDPPAPGPWGGAGLVESQLDNVRRFVREHTALVIPDPEARPDIPWVSTTPNQFRAPGQWGGGDGGYGNLSAWYAMAPFVLRPDQALEITGRFPPCRFANLVLWNRFMQTFDYTRRQVSCNRNQLHYEADGSYRIIVAHQDPGHPNWLATEGRISGLMYWRFLAPRSTPETPVARVIPA